MAERSAFPRTGVLIASALLGMLAAGGVAVRLAVLRIIHGVERQG